MITSDRRGIVRFFGLLATFPLAGLAHESSATTGSIVIPTRPFILRRELMRGLARGASLLVTREWQGRFESVDGLTMATGEQQSCTVEAPDVLEPIAAIERERQSPGPFPARLDSAGRIVGEQPTMAQGKAAAVQAAIEVLEGLGKSGEELREAKQALAQLGQTSGALISETPPDLFFPVVGAASDKRTVALPGGLVGEVVVEIAASAGPGGLLDRFERRIVTRIGEDARESRETWQLRMA